MNVDENGSVAKASVQNMTGFILLKGKVKMTIRKVGQSTETTTLTSHTTWQGLALSSLHLHMIWMIEHCCVEVKAYGQTARLELWCHHSGWGIGLQADAAQIG